MGQIWDVCKIDNRQLSSRHYLRQLGVGERIILKWNLKKERMRARSCKHGSELSDAIKSGFYNQFSDLQFSNKIAPPSYLQ
jgi:hypothetical protein